MRDTIILECVIIFSMPRIYPPKRKVSIQYLNNRRKVMALQKLANILQKHFKIKKTQMHPRRKTNQPQQQLQPKPSKIRIASSQLKQK